MSSFKRTKLHQNYFKSLVKPTISLNLLVLSLFLYKCFHFFNSILIFERIKYKFNLILFAYCCYATALMEVPDVSFANKNVSGLQKCLRFQNEYNKVEIELRVVQFWNEIKLVITNRTPASWSCVFVITCLISVQIALHALSSITIINSMFPI